MKFTLRDLVWATLVAALLLVIGVNWIEMRREAERQQEQWEHAVVAEMEARALVERAVKSEEIARVRAEEAAHAQQKYAEQSQQLKIQLRAEQQRLETVRNEIERLESELAEKKSKAKVNIDK